MCIKMKQTIVATKKERKLIRAEISVPSSIHIKYEDGILHLIFGEKEVSRILHPMIIVTVEANKIILSTRKTRKIEKRMVGTFVAHIKNMIEGLEKNFMYKLQVVNVHFPMTVTYDKAKHELVVKNFLGEKNDRRISIAPDVEVKVNKDIIEVQSHDIEKAGQTATSIEKGTKVRNKDRRVYQDGIFIIEKPGRSYL
ncbi:MAG: 50S ribosomal protein L6 [Nanoarchaeota archaeon]